MRQWRRSEAAARSAQDWRPVIFRGQGARVSQQERDGYRIRAGHGAVAGGVNLPAAAAGGEAKKMANFQDWKLTD